MTMTNFGMFICGLATGVTLTLWHLVDDVETARTVAVGTAFVSGCIARGGTEPECRELYNSLVRPSK